MDDGSQSRRHDRERTRWRYRLLGRRLWLGQMAQPPEAGAPTGVVQRERAPRADRARLEAIAIEIERLGEGQLFTTRLLAEHERLQQASPPPPASPFRVI